VSTVGSTTTVNDTITFDGYTQTSIINGASPTTTKYYTAAGHTVAMVVGGTWYALVADGLGSTTLALKGDGTVQVVLTPIMMVSTMGIPFILNLPLAPL
jgi:hypothetical protein